MSDNEKKSCLQFDVEEAAKQYAEEFASGKRHDYTHEDPTLSTFEVNYARQYARDDYEFVMSKLAKTEPPTPQVKSTRKAYKPRVKKQKSNAEIFVEKLKNGTICRPEDSLRYGDPNCRSFELDEALIEQRDHRAIMDHLENIDPIIDELRGQKAETLSNNKESEE